jgi:hypothetical protein
MERPPLDTVSRELGGDLHGCSLAERHAVTASSREQEIDGAGVTRLEERKKSRIATSRFQ